MDPPSKNAVAGSSSSSKPKPKTDPKTHLKPKPQGTNNPVPTATTQTKNSGVIGSKTTSKPKGSIKSSSTTTTHTPQSTSNNLQPRTSPTSPSKAHPTGPSAPNPDPPSISAKIAIPIPPQPRGNKRKLAVIQRPARPGAPSPQPLNGQDDDPPRAGDVEDQVARDGTVLKDNEGVGEITLDGEERAGKKVRLGRVNEAGVVREGGTETRVVDEVPDSLEPAGETNPPGPSGSEPSLTTTNEPTNPNPTQLSTSHAPHPKPSKTHTYRRLAPPKPTYPTTLPPISTSLLKPGKSPQGSVPANNTSKPKNVILVSRNTGLGAYLRRCKGLLVNDGFATIHLHALSAAIPHSILILHALLDILPFPKRCVTYELKSGSVKCFDEKKSLGGGVVKQKKQVEAGEEGWEWEPVLLDDEDEDEDEVEVGKGKGKVKEKEKTDGTMWEEKGDVRVRIVSCLEIIIRVGLDQKKKKVDTQPGVLDPEVDKAEKALQKLRDKAGTGQAAQDPVVGPSTSGHPLRDTQEALAEADEPAQSEPKVKKPNRPNQKQRKALRKKATEAMGRGDGLQDANANATARAGETMDVDTEEGEEND